MLNHLLKSTSPYLLQHAGNPVDWYPWGPAALEKARREDLPIFLSIGYAACHWCHVMAHESFEDPETAAILNRHFVSIKVDREERPDLDNLYMSAVISLTGQGGWPMSLFLTPTLQPFYAGTYFPPERRHGLPAFKELLLGIARAWHDQRDELVRTGRDVAAHIIEEVGGRTAGRSFDPALLAAAGRALVDGYDWEHGGWGGAPKFPQPMSVEFLLRRHLSGDREALPPARHLLEAMRRGGMHDLVGGGFARYSTDPDWKVPHFEKMLYDNAQLARAYLHAWQVTGEPAFRGVVGSTLKFISRELLSEEGGFYSSLDADSDGGEGNFYAWTREELQAILGADFPLCEAAYDLNSEGNWEGRILLRRALDDSALAARFDLTETQVEKILEDCSARLLAARSTRPRPATDDKVLTAWNGLALSAFAEAGRALGNDRWLQIAARNADFLLTRVCEDGCLRRTWRLGLAGKEVFLDDYASLVLGLLDLYQADFNNRWFSEACRLAGEMVERFSDPQGGFFDTPTGAETLLTRPRDLQDNATPSGNALAVEALFRLAALTGNEDWYMAAEKALPLVAELSTRYPTAFGRWLCAADFGLGTVRQVAILGDPSEDCTRALLGEVWKTYRPNLVVSLSAYPPPQGTPALLADRPLVNGEPTAYVCEGFVCRLPVTEPQELAEQLQVNR